MKKFLFLFIVSTFSILSLIGCSDDSSNAPSTTGNDGNAGLKGMYNVVFFGNQSTNPQGGTGVTQLASSFYVTNNCDKAKELYPDIVNIGSKNQCSTDSNSVILDGVIAIDVKDGNTIVTSRLQMEEGVVDLSPSDKYQYTEYSPTKNISMGQGVKAWNYDEKNKQPSTAPVDFPDSTFEIKDNGDGTIMIKMLLKGKKLPDNGTIDAVVTVIAEKTAEPYNKPENKVTKPFKEKKYSI